MELEDLIIWKAVNVNNNEEFDTADYEWERE